MPTTILSPTPKLQFFTSNGVPLVGGKLYSYQAGTLTPLATYADSTGNTANPNPTILDSRGEANVWLSSSSYKFVLKDSNDVLIWTVDNISTPQALITALQNNLAASSGSSLVGFIQSGAGAVATTVQTKLRETLSVKDFGAVGNGSTDDTSAVQAALTAATGKSLYFPAGTYLCNGLIIYSGTTIYGDGPSSSIIKAKSSLSTSAPLLRNQNITGTAYVYVDTGIEIRDLGFNGNNLTPRTVGLIEFAKVYDALISNCKIYDIQYIGLALGGCLSVNVTNCLFSNCGNTAVSAEGGPALWTGSSADATISFDISVTENSFISNNWSAMYITGNRMSITGNYMSSNKESAVFMTGSNNVLADNWVSGQTRKNISASGFEIGGDNITISGNYIGDVQSDCISLTDTQFVTVTGNTLLNPMRDSVTFSTGSCISIASLTASPDQPRYLTIVGNNMWAPLSDAYAAITVGGAGSAPAYCLISDNQLSSNSWTSGTAIYFGSNLVSTTITIRDNPGYFDVFDQGGYAAARFYAGETMSPGSAAGTLALSANVMYAMPFIVRQQKVWTKIGCHVTTGVASRFAYLGIYRMENGIPTSLVLDAGAVGVDTAGTKEITVSKPLLSGTYALVILVNNSGVSIRAGTPSDVAQGMIGASAVGTANTLITASQAYGTLPNTFPAVSYLTSSTPLLTLRYGV